MIRLLIVIAALSASAQALAEGYHCFVRDLGLPGADLRSSVASVRLRKTGDLAESLRTRSTVWSITRNGDELSATSLDRRSGRRSQAAGTDGKALAVKSPDGTLELICYPQLPLSKIMERIMEEDRRDFGDPAGPESSR